MWENTVLYFSVKARLALLRDRIVAAVLVLFGWGLTRSTAQVMMMYRVRGVIAPMVVSSLVSALSPRSPGRVQPLLLSSLTRKLAMPTSISLGKLYRLGLSTISEIHWTIRFG